MKSVIALLMALASGCALAESIRNGDADELRAKSPAVIEFKTTAKPESARKIIATMSRKCYERGGRVSMTVAADGMTVETAISGMLGRSIMSLTDISEDGDGALIKTYLGGDGPGFKTRADFIQKWLEGGKLCPGDIS